jgi:hypothetical protein
MAEVWPFAPNWRLAPYAVRREYRTDLIRTRAGKEQRRALRQTPRKRINFIATQTGDCLRALDARMLDAQRVQLALADRPRWILLPNGIAGGADNTIVDTVPSWIIVGAELVLVDGSRHAIRTVNAIDVVTGGTKLTFDETEALAWPVDTRLHPSLNGYLDANISAPNLSRRGVVPVAVVYHVDPGFEAAEDVGAAAFTFGGRELFLTWPTAWNPVALSRVQGDVGKVDYGFGRVRRFFPVAFSSRMWTATYAGCDFATSDALRQFFDRMKGRAHEFYMPTFQPDLVPLSALTTAGTTISVSGDSVATDYAGSTVFTAISVRLADGSWIHRKIDSLAAASGDITVITVTAAWGQNVALADIKLVSWLPVWRFASDIQTTTWQRPDQAEVQMAFQMIEDLAEMPGAGTASISVGMSGDATVFTVAPVAATASISVGMSAHASGILAARATASITVGMAADAREFIGDATATATITVGMTGDAIKKGTHLASATASADVDMSADGIKLPIDDPDWLSVSFLSGFNGTDGQTTFTDEGPGAHSITTVADAQVDTAQSKFDGASLLTDGDGDGLLVPNHADFQFGSGPFTIEFYVRLDVYNTQDWLVALYDTSSQKSWGIYRQSGNVYFLVSTNGTSQVARLSPAVTFALDTWYHVCVDKDASNVYRLYMDGVMQQKATVSETLHASTGKLSIAGYTTSGFLQGAFSQPNGWFDEMRITKGVARYASDGGFTVPTLKYPRS